MSPQQPHDELTNKTEALAAQLAQATQEIGELTQKERELSTILAAIPLFMMTVNHHRQVQDVSQSVLKFTHQRLEEVRGRREGEVLRCLHHLDSEDGCGFGPDCPACAVRRTIQDTLDTGRSHTKVPVRFAFLGAPHAERSLLITTAPLDIPERQAIVFVEDITEREQAVRALRQSEHRLEKAQQIAHLGCWDWDVVTNELIWSTEIYRIFGITPQEFDATYEAFLAFVHPDDREFVTQAVHGAVTEKTPYNITHRIVRPDGSQRIVREQGEVTFDETGNAVHIMGTVQDITEQTQTEDRLKELGGLLPICAACKKIRNDQGYWTVLESYFRKHSDVEFSHAICPDCTKTLYGDLE